MSKAEEIIKILTHDYAADTNAPTDKTYPTLFLDRSATQFGSQPIFKQMREERHAQAV